MVSTNEPGSIHPKLANTLNQHFEGLMFFAAQGMLNELLVNGSNAIQLDEPEAAEAHADALVEELQTVLPAVSSELRRYGDREGRISARTVDTVLNGFCPFPPFCYGRTASPEEGIGARSGFAARPGMEVEESREVRTMEAGA